MTLQTAVQRRPGQVRDRRLEGVEAVVQRQQRVTAERHDHRLLPDQPIIEHPPVGVPDHLGFGIALTPSLEQRPIFFLARAQRPFGPRLFDRDPGAMGRFLHDDPLGDGPLPRTRLMHGDRAEQPVPLDGWDADIGEKTYRLLRAQHGLADARIAPAPDLGPAGLIRDPET